MRRALLVLLVAAGAAQPLGAQHLVRWSAGEVALAAAFTTTLWIDVAQTREGIRRGYAELNPLLPTYPSIGQVHSYAAIVNIGVLGAAAVVKRPWRSVLLGAATIIELITIHENAQVGLAVRF